MAKSGLFQGSEAVAEAARDKAAYGGFLAGLFEADVRWDLFNNIRIPEVSAPALDFLEGLKTFLRIPSISTLSEHKPDIRRAAEFAVNELRAYLAEVKTRNGGAPRYHGAGAGTLPGADRR